MKKICVVVLCLCAVSAEARRYRYYLDASRAEEILASLGTRQRLYDDQWVRIIGDERKDGKYKVRRGDSLWNISGRQLGNARLWPKMWQVNPYLTNPHEIEIGQLLRYYNGDASDRDPAAIRIPMVKLLPGGSGSANNLDNDSFFNRTLKNRFRPKLIVVADEEILGEISGAYTEGDWLNIHHEIYLNFFQANTVRKDDVYAIVRFERSLVDSTESSRPVIGSLVRVVGEVRVIGFGENLVRAEIKSQFDVVKRGDSLIRTLPPVSTSAYFNPPSEMTARIVTGADAERSQFAQGEVVLLNKGADDGMKEGYVFRVFEDVDPQTKKRYLVEPSYKGEVQVVYVSKLASVGYIVRNRTPLAIADTLIPTQAYVDPEPPPSKSVKTIELQ